MHKGIILFTLLAVVLSCAATGADHGFDGKWVLDKNGSNTGTMPPPDGLQQRIKTNGNNIVIESVFKEPATGVAPLAVTHFQKHVQTVHQLRLALRGQFAKPRAILQNTLTFFRT